MLFTGDAHEGLRSGAIDLTFRTWRAPRAKVGGRHRVAGIVLVIDAVDRVPVASITDRDARRAGAADRPALLARLGNEEEVWRVAFHRDDAAAPQPPSADEALARVRRWSWAPAVLHLIADRPGVVSTELAATVGRPRHAFKADVRRLKALGLTESLEVGYRLTPLGSRVLAALGEAVDVP